jgi:acyl-coenzyme A synthetase/AMP-(fatty) acid ligase
MTLADLIARSGARERVVETRDHQLRLADFANASALAERLGSLEGRCVVLHVRDMALAAAALIDLDGWARRIVLCPPGWGPEPVASAATKADAEAIVHDRLVSPVELPIEVHCALPMRAVQKPAGGRGRATEWVLPTSGTSGPPKLVVHTLATLTGAIAETPKQEWATFYDIRRYGGLQILLRALAGEGSLRMNGADESVEEFLTRLGEVGVTHISGTPSHWRKALMSGEAARIEPEYVRLSGEIADNSILEALQAQYPQARVEHAYASTEAGVAFTVSDGQAGFPAAWVERSGPVRLRVVDGALGICSDRRALRILGADAPRLADDEGFVDTGDMVELRGDRYLFIGRRGGIINVGGAKVHPEEVEAVINAHPAVQASRVFARRNPITGAIVVADVVLHPGAGSQVGLEREIMDVCRGRLPAHMAPARLRFVPELPMTDGGKLMRHG